MLLEQKVEYCSIRKNIQEFDCGVHITDKISKIQQCWKVSSNHTSNDRIYTNHTEAMIDMMTTKIKCGIYNDMQMLLTAGIIFGISLFFTLGYGGYF